MCVRSNTCRRSTWVLPASISQSRVMFASCTLPAARQGPSQKWAITLSL